MNAVNERVRDLLSGEGVAIASFYVCPHGPDEGCGCRKPLPGLAEQAVGELGLDPKSSILIGDKESDVELGRAIDAYTARLASSGTATSADLVASGWMGLTPLLEYWLAKTAEARRPLNLPRSSPPTAE